MTCPYCGREMKGGFISGDGRSGVYWNEGTGKRSISDKIVGVGRITAARHTLTQFRIGAFYCDSCKKMIFDAGVSD